MGETASLKLGAGHVVLAEHHSAPRRGAKRHARSRGVTARLQASCRAQRSRRLKLSGVQRPPDRQHQRHQRGLHCDQHEGAPQQAILARKAQVQKPQASLIRSTGRDHRACDEAQSCRSNLLSVDAAEVEGQAKATSRAASASAHETAPQPACRRAPASILAHECRWKRSETESWQGSLNAIQEACTIREVATDAMGNPGSHGEAPDTRCLPSCVRLPSEVLCLSAARWPRCSAAHAAARCADQLRQTLRRYRRGHPERNRFLGRILDRKKNHIKFYKYIKSSSKSP